MAEEITVIVDDTQETVSLFVDDGVTAHSELTLDDGTNPHATTKTDVGLGNVPNTDFTTAVGLNTAKETNIAHPLVETAVPIGAVFTDTVYDDTTIQSEVDLNTAKVGVTNEEANTINSEPIGNEVQILQVVSISQANYDLITPVATTFYIIV